MARSPEAMTDPKTTATPHKASTAFRRAEKAVRNHKAPTIDVHRHIYSVPAAADTAAATARRAPLAAPAPAGDTAAAYTLDGVDGFTLLAAALDSEQQLELAAHVLHTWIEPPAATNLVAHAPPPHANLWKEHLRQPDGSLLSKLTWATIGYQYQWTSRQYDEAHVSPMPARLSELATQLAAACGLRLRAQAAILNLYHGGSSMCGHRDDAEPCQSAPIVSISLGMDAVYLLGRESRDVPPVAMRLRAGDVVVQGGASRAYVHGVPAILKREGVSDEDDAEAIRGHRADLASWLGSHRLNINVRQCFDF